MPRDVQRLSWKKSGSGYLPPLPNANSEHRTATTVLIDIHYSNKRIAERWNWERLQRLCSFLKITEYELASLVCCPHEWIPKIKEHDRIPASVTGGGRAVALLLTLLEARVLKKLVPDVVKNPIPNLNHVIKNR